MRIIQCRLYGYATRFLFLHIVSRKRCCCFDSYLLSKQFFTQKYWKLYIKKDGSNYRGSLDETTHRRASLWRIMARIFFSVQLLAFLFSQITFPCSIQFLKYRRLRHWKYFFWSRSKITHRWIAKLDATIWHSYCTTQLYCTCQTFRTVYICTTLQGDNYHCTARTLDGLWKSVDSGNTTV